MRTRKRVLHIRKHSRIASSNGNLWLFSEDGADIQSVNPKRKSVKSDRLSILNEDYDRYSLEDSHSRMNRKECPFVVDWQMSDTL